MKSSIFLFLMLTTPIWSAPSGKETNTHLFLQELRSRIEQQSYQLNSQKVEVDLLQEKVRELDDGVADLKKQVGAQAKLEGALTNERVHALEKRLTLIEKTNDTIISDLQQLKNHYNESSSHLVEYSAKLSDLDKQVTQDIKSLKKAVESLVTLLQKPKEQTSHASNNYKVKPGDSLGKIAQDNHVDIKILKELNELKDDKIIAGQLLLLP